jgi:glycosidase
MFVDPSFFPKSHGDRFTAIREELDCFTDFGADLIHIPRMLAESSDALFAVEDYRQVDEWFGTTHDRRGFTTGMR